MSRLAVPDDARKFAKLWAEMLVEHHKLGDQTLPTDRTLEYIMGWFFAYTKGKLPGVVVFGDEISSSTSGVLMWGALCPEGLPYDVSWGRAVHAWGHYVRPPFRKQGVFLNMAEKAIRLLKKKGFDAVVGGITLTNEPALAAARSVGFKPLGSAGVARF